MEYYLTKLTAEIKETALAGPCYINTVKVKQLVKASDKEKAREAVKKALLAEYPTATILEIRVNDTLIGE